MTVDRLASFTPVGPDVSELLFRMGRDSVPTLRWKLGVAALLVTNAALAWIALQPMPPATTVVPVVVPIRVVEPLPDSTPTEPSRYGPIRVHADPDRWPALEPLAGVVPPGPPLTPLAGHRGEID